MEKIKKLGIISFARFQAILGALIGLVLGVIYSFGGFLVDLLVTLGWISSSETPGLSVGTILAFGALIGMPLIGLLVGFLLGILEAMLYNVYARILGGLRLKFE